MPETCLLVCSVQGWRGIPLCNEALMRNKAGAKLEDPGSRHQEGSLTDGEDR